MEKKLIANLKDFCTPKPDDTTKLYEYNPKESSEIFHKLGTVYTKKRHPKEIIHVRLIQSAALLAAAKIRNPVMKVGRDLEKLWYKVQVKAKAKYPDKSLSKISEQIKAKVIEMRYKTRQTLDQLPKINYNITEQERVKQEKNKITIVQELQNDIAATYTSIMRNVAKISLDILGEVPCKFALIGMGSLAKKEITPYSDFECAILLEEGVQELLSYEDILEYFRWFAVIFQIILISLGETILPSVAISGLNDFNKENGDWFYDNITPSGISFDGFMPHACKTPLGRQEPTKKKPWKTELIKPVSKMLQYLNSEEHLKNGYKLADVLTQTCFVHGDERLFNDFSARANLERLLNQQEYEDMIEKDLKEDLKNFRTEQALFELIILLKIKVKTACYRNPTIFLAAIAKLLRYELLSSFEIISKLEENQEISKRLEHKLKYVVAISCELRLKVYQEYQKQDDTVKLLFSSDGNKTTPLICDLVGKKCVVDFFTILLSIEYNFPFKNVDVLSHYYRLVGFFKSVVVELPQETVLRETCKVHLLFENYQHLRDLITNYLQDLNTNFAGEIAEAHCMLGISYFMQHNHEEHKAKNLFVECVCSYFGKTIHNLRGGRGYFSETDSQSLELHKRIYYMYCKCIYQLKRQWKNIRELPPCFPTELQLDDRDAITKIENLFADWIEAVKQNNTYKNISHPIEYLQNLLLGYVKFYQAVQDLRRDIEIRWPQLYHERMQGVRITRKRKAEENKLLQQKAKKYIN